MNVTAMLRIHLGVLLVPPMLLASAVATAEAEPAFCREQRRARPPTSRSPRDR